jgi:hypothetical protein
MKLSLLIALLVAASFAAYAQSPTPRMTLADPVTGKVGDVITVTGENLSKDFVAKVYLTDGNEKNDREVQITEQTATSLKFKIPAKASGPMALMILTVAKPQQLIQQPVRVEVTDATAQQQ